VSPFPFAFLRFPSFENVPRTVTPYPRFHRNIVHTVASPEAVSAFLGRSPFLLFENDFFPCFASWSPLLLPLSEQRNNFFPPHRTSPSPSPLSPDPRLVGSTPVALLIRSFPPPLVIRSLLPSFLFSRGALPFSQSRLSSQKRRSSSSFTSTKRASPLSRGWQCF